MSEEEKIQNQNAESENPGAESVPEHVAERRADDASIEPPSIHLHGKKNFKE